MNRRYVQAGVKDSEINMLSLKRAKDREKEHSSICITTHYPLWTWIYSWAMNTNSFLKTTCRNLLRLWFFPWAHLTSMFLELVLENSPVLAQQW